MKNNNNNSTISTTIGTVIEMKENLYNDMGLNKKESNKMDDTLRATAVATVVVGAATIGASIVKTIEAKAIASEQMRVNNTINIWQKAYADAYSSPRAQEVYDKILSRKQIFGGGLANAEKARIKYAKKFADSACK